MLLDSERQALHEELITRRAGAAPTGESMTETVATFEEDSSFGTEGLLAVSETALMFVGKDILKGIIFKTWPVKDVAGGVRTSDFMGASVTVQVGAAALRFTHIDTAVAAPFFSQLVAVGIVLSEAGSNDGVGSSVSVVPPEQAPIVAEREPATVPVPAPAEPRPPHSVSEPRGAAKVSRSDRAPRPTEKVASQPSSVRTNGQYLLAFLPLILVAFIFMWGQLWIFGAIAAVIIGRKATRYFASRDDKQLRMLSQVGMWLGVMETFRLVLPFWQYPDAMLSIFSDMLRHQAPWLVGVTVLAIFLWPWLRKELGIKK